MKEVFKKNGGNFFAAIFMLTALFLFSLSDVNAAYKSRVKGSIYILSAEKAGASCINMLSLADINAKTIKNIIRLDKGNIETISRDTYGRFWAGYSSPDGRRENRVQVFSTDGSFSKIIRTADNPEAGIVFSGKRAFVACTQNGFSGTLEVFDLDKLKYIKTIKLTSGIKNTPYYLTAIASDKKRITVAGMTTGPLQRENYCIITVIDPESLSIITQTRLFAGVDIWNILPYRGTFFMLNTAPRKKTDGKSPDILVLKSDNKIREISYVPSPLLGTITGDILYAYHNPAFNSVSGSPSRILSAYNLKTKKYEAWPLPEKWDCTGIAVDRDSILLLNADAPDKKARGIYSFSLEDNKLSLVMNIPGATKMLFER